MIKNLKNITVATMAILMMLNTKVVFADSKDISDEKEIAKVNVEKLNIRSGPSISNEIIGSFEKEDSVNVISIKDGWYKIKLEDGKKAWTNGEYITLYGKITADKLNIRTGPSIEDEIIGTKKKDDKITIVNAYENGWYKIKLSNKNTGYVCGKYVKTMAENKHDYSNLNKKESNLQEISTDNEKDSDSSKEASSLNVVKAMTVSATAYAGDSITSTGKKPKVGRTIAVDPSVIPYGTKVYIPALKGTYIAEDCGGAIKGNKIDIFMASESQCKSWGVKTIEIQILK